MAGQETHSRMINQNPIFLRPFFALAIGCILLISCSQPSDLSFTKTLEGDYEIHSLSLAEPKDDQITLFSLMIRCSDNMNYSSENMELISYRNLLEDKADALNVLSIKKSVYNNHSVDVSLGNRKLLSLETPIGSSKFSIINSQKICELQPQTLLSVSYDDPDNPAGDIVQLIGMLKYNPANMEYDLDKLFNGKNYLYKFYQQVNGTHWKCGAEDMMQVIRFK